MNRDKLLIIGAGGHGCVVVDLAIKMKRYSYIAFLDDDAMIKNVMGIKVIGRSSDFLRYIKDYDIFIAIGNNEIREKMHLELERNDAVIPTLIHPGAIIGSEVIIGPGTVVMAGAIINCRSVIGKSCIINTSATLDHDNVLEDYVHISPGVHTAGAVRIGKKTWIGIGAGVSNNINICGRCTIGAGSVVVKDIEEAGTHVGIPVKRL